MLSEVPNNVKSPLNYTGGKYRLLDQIQPLFQNTSVFVDLFSGGCNVGANSLSKKVICVDNRPELIRLMNLFKTYDSKLVIDSIEEIIKKYELSNTLLNGYEYYGCNSSNGVGSYNKNGYIALRRDYNELSVSEEKDLHLLSLIIFSFNNQIRYNSKGEFNNPVGKRDFNNSIRKNLVHFMTRLKSIDIDFSCNDFRDFPIDTSSDVLVYCDPPYYLGTASYNENGGWTEKDETDLLAYLQNLDSQGVPFALSNFYKHKGFSHDALIEWVKNNNYNTHYIDSSYSNSNYQKNGQDTCSTVEVLITNY